MDDFVLLVFRGDSVMFKKSEIINLIREEWFLANILEMKFVDQQIPDKLEICEDKNTAMSLIETMRYNKLVVYPNVSLDYLLALADKWCVPEYVIKMITDRIIHNVNVNRMESNMNSLKFDEVETKITFRCVNCKEGFKISENTSESCSFHPDDIHAGLGIRKCCGNPADSKPCRKAYHVMSYFDLKSYNELKQNLKGISDNIT
tara:strand:+ start:536 stop:1147 length:612 start_codon:yes stop_codon:yes gene_type:complete